MAPSRVLFPLALVLATAAVTGLLARELSRAWFLPALQSELVRQLEQSQADQRELARLAPQTAGERRARFDRTQALLGHLHVLSLSRAALARRHAMLLLAGAVGVAVGAGVLHTWRQGRRDRRLARLQGALRDLADGVAHVEVRDSGHDVIGEVARMVEQVSAVHASQRRRLRSLEDLSRWQEAARRHAHEMRTPLGAARLDLQGVQESLPAVADPLLRERLAGGVRDVESGLLRLGEFAAAFAAFGRLPPPQLRDADLGVFVREFVGRFARAWPELELTAEAPDGPCSARIDPDQLRQVLVNLCDNAAAAGPPPGVARGSVRLELLAVSGGWTIDVADDGPGIMPEAKERLFQPYATFRAGGTGLGLAISRKIALDHGGDLEHLPSEAGATFRLSLPAAERGDGA